MDEHGGRLVISETVRVENDDRFIIEYTTVTKDFGEFDASGPRGAAGWTLFVSCACFIFHFILLFFLFGCKEYDTEKHNTPYSTCVSQ